MKRGEQEKGDFSFSYASNDLQSILSSIGAQGWNILSACINSSNSITPFLFSSNRSKTWKVVALENWVLFMQFLPQMQSHSKGQQ